MRVATIVVVCLLAALAACEGTPTSPSRVTADADRPAMPDPLPRREALTMRHPDRGFSDQFWRELIFDGYEGDFRRQRAWPLPRHPNVYIQMVDEHGRRTFSEDALDHMKQTIPHLGPALRGNRYDGRVEVGDSVRPERSGWVKVEVMDGASHPCGQNACACAWLGADEGHIWFVRERYMTGDTFHMDRLSETGCAFVGTFAHELGHSYGLWHVSAPTAVMSPLRPRRLVQWFSRQEGYHAILAHREMMRGDTYCGWPYGPECMLRKLPPQGSQGNRILIVD